MPLIEGVGDEVTFVFGILLLVIVILLAWFSTHTDDLSLFREVGVIVVELSQRGTLYRNNRAEAAEETPTVSGQQAPTENSSPSPDASDEVNEETSSPVENATSSSTIDSPVNTTNQSNPSIDSAPQSDTSNRALQTATHGDRDVKNTNEERDSDGIASDNTVPEEEVVITHSESSNDLASHPPINGEEIRQRRVQYFQGDGHQESQAQTSLSHDGSCATSCHVNGASAHLQGLETEEQLLVTSSHIKLENSSNTNQSLSRETDIAENQSASASSSEVTVSDVSLESSQQPGASSDNLPDSQICVKLRYMNETQRFVFAKPDDTIGDFRRTHFQSELEDNKWVRFIFNGQDLRDDARTLHACNVVNNSTMHCLVTAQSRSQPQHDAAADDEEDSMLGTLMYPLFTILLAVVWYFRFTYRQYFSAMSTVCLIGISFILVLSYISSFRTSDSQQPQQPAQSTAPGSQNSRQRDSNAN